MDVPHGPAKRPRAEPGTMPPLGITFDEEPTLPEVAEEDKTLVRNILYVAKALQSVERTFSSWQVQVKSDGYLVVLYLSPGFSLSLGDLQTLRDVSTLRVQSVQVRDDDGRAQLRVRVVNHKVPVMVTEVEIVRVVKRSRGWWFT
jgi:hypothetical protein